MARAPSSDQAHAPSKASPSPWPMLTKIGASPGELARSHGRAGPGPTHAASCRAYSVPRSTAGTAIVLLVDQFEEIFTLCQDESQRQALMDNLLLRGRRGRWASHCPVDFPRRLLREMCRLPALAAALAEHQVLVGPMTDDELHRAIERPAQLAGCELEPGLAQRLVDDVRDQPGGLPLLQHALLELWERRRGNRLSHETYENIGGVGGALERRAEEVFGRFSTDEQAICRRIFLRLTQPGEGTEDTKRRATLGELLPADGDPQAVDAVLLALASPDTRLVTTEGQGDEQYVEAAHEALIRGWARLRRWIDQDRQALRSSVALQMLCGSGSNRGGMTVTCFPAPGWPYGR